NILNPDSITNWEKKARKIERGTVQPFDVEAWQANQDRLEEATDLRKERREAKWLRKGLLKTEDQGDDSPDELATDARKSFFRSQPLRQRANNLAGFVVDDEEDEPFRSPLERRVVQDSESEYDECANDSGLDVSLAKASSKETLQKTTRRKKVKIVVAENSASPETSNVSGTATSPGVNKNIPIASPQTPSTSKIGKSTAKQSAPKPALARSATVPIPKTGQSSAASADRATLATAPTSSSVTGVRALKSASKKPSVAEAFKISYEPKQKARRSCYIISNRTLDPAGKKFMTLSERRRYQKAGRDYLPPPNPGGEDLYNPKTMEMTVRRNSVPEISSRESSLFCAEDTVSPSREADAAPLAELEQTRSSTADPGLSPAALNLGSFNPSKAQRFPLIPDTNRSVNEAGKVPFTCYRWSASRCHEDDSDCHFLHRETDQIAPLELDMQREGSGTWKFKLPPLICWYWYNWGPCTASLVACRGAHWNTGLVAAKAGRDGQQPVPLDDPATIPWWVEKLNREIPASWPPPGESSVSAVTRKAPTTTRDDICEYLHYDCGAVAQPPAGFERRDTGQSTSSSDPQAQLPPPNTYVAPTASMTTSTAPTADMYDGLHISLIPPPPPPPPPPPAPPVENLTEETAALALSPKVGESSTARMFRALFNIDAEKMFKGETRVLLKRNVLLIFNPDLHALEIEIATNWLHSVGATVYHAGIPGTLEHFYGKIKNGVLIFHPNMTDFAKIPRLNYFMRTKKEYSIYQLGCDPEETTSAGTEIYSLVPLFPFGFVTFVTDDLFHHYPADAIALLRGIQLRNAAEKGKASAQGWRVFTRPGIKAFLEALMDIADDQQQMRIKLYLEYCRMVPLKLESRVFGDPSGTPGPDAPVFSPSTTGAPEFASWYEKAPRAATAWAVELFAGWAQKQARSWGRFFVVGGTEGEGEREGWREKWQHLAVMDGEKFKKSWVGSLDLS
ncbi:hypothetical protein LTS18_004356, partial [Coniosporium uncinatum]